MPVTTLTCPSGCDDVAALPIVSFDDCAPTIKSSELIYAYVALASAADFSDVSNPTEWAERLTQDTTAPVGSVTTSADFIRTLTVTGDMGAPTSTDIDISGGRKYTVKSDRTINVDLDDATDENYNFARTTECGFFHAKAWFETKGGMMLGGNGGIDGKLILHPVFARGADSIEKYSGTYTWSDKISPDRFASPVAH